MEEREIDCITWARLSAEHEHITHIGNSAQGWRLGSDVAIERIEWRKEAYYTVNPGTGQRTYLGVMREPGKPPYLRAYVDGKWTDHLLAQKECGS